ncbi:LysR family transcriptional regulator [Mesorhizobium huakuii]|uniref:LysR family transcriptional regulator n=1 Tax=Mesorhizobium huakuii TaxID=28104 RepID=A0A7G6SS12_9HYPH|nr:LysR family transcriptional regulator [Mesorhizobium huakuii]QND57294.1 LysR family transcriptional regulator [Mesorhizobium huakuii]
MLPDFNMLSVFALVAEERSFRAAGERLGVTRSAVSQTIRRLEENLGIALVSRTTRSVSLTEAGEQLYEDVAPAIADVRAALSQTEQWRDRPRGHLRLAVSSIAERFLSGPFLAGFTEANPEIRLDITVTDEEFDIVAEGYDAGVRLGEVIEQDMIAVPVAGDERQLTVCSPAYRDRFGIPDLAGHRCIGWRPSPKAVPYRWEFTEDGKDFSVAVAPEITTNDMELMIKLAVAGAGITFGMEESFRPFVERGELVPLLEDYCPRFAGFYLYYPSRRNAAPKLRALVEHLRRCKG